MTVHDTRGDALHVTFINIPETLSNRFTYDKSHFLSMI